MTILDWVTQESFCSILVHAKPACTQIF